MSLINEPIQNSVLEAAEQQLEGKLTPAIHEAYARIVVAGMMAALHGDKGGILASLRDSKDPISDCAIGAVNLCLILRKKSRGTMPLNAMVPAAMTLMLHALDFANKIGVVQIGTPELVRATHIFAGAIMKNLGITQQILQNAIGKVHAVTQNQDTLEKMKTAAGINPAPGAPIAAQSSAMPSPAAARGLINGI